MAFAWTGSWNTQGLIYTGTFTATSTSSSPFPADWPTGLVNNTWVGTVTASTSGAPQTAIFTYVGNYS